MSLQQQLPRNAYMQSGGPVYQLFPPPIVAKRAPTTTDRAVIGTIWVQPTDNATPPNAVNSAWILTSVIAGVSNWADFSGGSSSFTSLTVNPGPTNLSTVGNGAVTIGNSSNTGLVSVQVGSGNFTVFGNGNVVSIGADAHANAVNIGSTTAGALTFIDGGNGTGVGTAAINLVTAAAGDIAIGAATHTGAILVGNSTASSGETVSIANSATAGTTTVNVLSGSGSAGASALHLGDNVRVTAITIGNSLPAASRTTTVNGTAISTAVTDTLNLATGGVSTSASASKVVNIASGTNLLGTTTVNIATGTAASGTKTVNIGNSDALTPTNINGLVTVTGANLVIGSASTASVGALQFTSGGPRIMAGSGAPASGLALVVGDLYINTTAATTTTRLYIATAAGTWTYFTSNA